MKISRQDTHGIFSFGHFCDPQGIPDQKKLVPNPGIFFVFQRFFDTVIQCHGKSSKSSFNKINKIFQETIGCNARQSESVIFLFPKIDNMIDIIQISFKKSFSQEKQHHSITQITSLSDYFLYFCNFKNYLFQNPSSKSVFPKFFSVYDNGNHQKPIIHGPQKTLRENAETF